MCNQGISEADVLVDRIARGAGAVVYRSSPPPSERIERAWGDLEGLFGCSLSAREGATGFRSVLPEDRSRVRQAHLAIRRPGDTASALVRMRHADSGVVPVALRAWGVFAPDGSLQAVEGHVVPLDVFDEHYRFARGVIHDLNNMHSVLLLASSQGARLAAGNDMLQDLLETTQQVVSAANDLTTRLAHFDGPATFGSSVLDTELLQLTPLLRCLLGPDATLVLETNAEGAEVALGANELLRIALNLASNAKEAMSSGGTVTLRTSVCLIEGKRHVRLECADTGAGIPPDELPRIMKDGVSSKRGGTGLGLGIVRGLVTSAGGDLDVATRAEGGAVFAVVLPVPERAGPEPRG